MTISSTANRATFSGSGTTGPFPFPYPLITKADLVVISVNNTTAVETTLVLDTDYTLAGTPDSVGRYNAGVNITTTSAVASGYTLVTFSDPALTQAIDFVENDPDPVEQTELGLDKLTLIARRLDDRIERALRVSDGTTGINTELPTPVGNSAIGWNASATELINITMETGTSLADLGAENGSALIGFTQSGTGAVLRTEQDKLREIQVSITDFDESAGTGTAAIDQAAIVAAIASLPAAGGEIHFPVTATSIYTLTSKPSVGSKRITFKHHGNVEVSPTTYLPDGTHVIGFRQVTADAETDFSGALVLGDTVDQTAIGGSKVNGFKVEHRFGSTATTGGRHGMYSRLIQDAATSATNTDRNYVAMQSHVITSYGDGGTNLGAGAKGAYFGVGSIVHAQPTAVNIYNLTGGEFNTYIQAGATVSYKSGIQIASLDEVQGNSYDCLLALSRISGLGNKHAILMGDMNGLAPCSTTGTLIGTTGTATVDKGIDFSNYTFTTSILKTDLVNLTSLGLQLLSVNASVEIGSVSSSGFGVIDFHTSGNNIDYDSRIVASGGTGSLGQGKISFVAAKIEITVPGNYANDAAAAGGGVAVGEIYRNGSVLMIRVT